MVTATEVPISSDVIPGTHFQLAPEWSHVEIPTIATLAYVFCEPVRVVRSGAWLAGDEIEYLKDDDEIPASLLDPILLHLAEVHERKHGWVEPTAQPVTFAQAATWLAGTHPSEVLERLCAWFNPLVAGGYVLLPKRIRAYMKWGV